MKTRVLLDEPDGLPPPTAVPMAGGRRPGSPPAGAPQAGTASTTSLGRPALRRYRLTLFFLLSLALSWCLLPIGTFLPAGPLLAALVVVSVTEGRAGLRQLGGRLVRWRVSWVWYAAAVGLPLAVHLVTASMNVALGAVAPSLDQLSPWYAVLLVLGLRLVSPLDGALGEEPGFRGYAQPRLQQRRSPLRATGVLAGFVVVWHLPLLFLGDEPMRPVDLVSTVAVTFWYAWLLNRTGGSVLLTVLAHATEGSVQIGALWPSGADNARVSTLYCLVWCCVAVGLLVLDRAVWRLPPPPEPSPLPR